MPRPVQNPPNPWASTQVEWLEQPPNATLQIFEERAKSILSENDSPDLPFRFSLNPYRGCLHACAYCYARPSHQYLGFGAGTDFDRKIVVKTNASELLREAFLRPSWKGENIVFSGNTDCYQALEANYEITRKCIEVCLEFQNPISIITKSRLVARDAVLLAELSRRAQVMVFLSIPFARDEDALKIEPWAAKTSLRFSAMRILSDAGIPVGIAIAPIIPGLNDSDVPELLERAKEAGAGVAFTQPLRLAAEVLPVFEERLQEAYPLRVNKVKNAVLELRGGKMNESAFGARFSGQGPRWAMIEKLFDAHCARLGLNRERISSDVPSTFRRPNKQLSLFYK
jgi:DNA repair photolyase